MGMTCPGSLLGVGPSEGGRLCTGAGAGAGAGMEGEDDGPAPKNDGGGDCGGGAGGALGDVIVCPHTGQGPVTPAMEAGTVSTL